MSENIRIELPPFCDKHTKDLIHGAKYKESDPWRALLIAGQIAMFQGATATPSVHIKIEGDISRISEIGCFACRLPHKFETLIQTARDGGLTEVKTLGEGWIESASDARLSTRQGSVIDNKKGG